MLNVSDQVQYLFEFITITGSKGNLFVLESVNYCTEPLKSRFLFPLVVTCKQTDKWGKQDFLWVNWRKEM